MSMEDRIQEQRVIHARQQSYTGKAVTALVLYIFLWVPGFIANVLFYKEAKRMERIAGERLPGVGCLSALFWGAIVIIAIPILLAVILLGAGSH